MLESRKALASGAKAVLPPQPLRVFPVFTLSPYVLPHPWGGLPCLVLCPLAPQLTSSSLCFPLSLFPTRSTHLPHTVGGLHPAPIQRPARESRPAAGCGAARRPPSPTPSGSLSFGSQALFSAFQ